MPETGDQMLCAKSNRLRSLGAFAVLNIVVALVGANRSFAQEPPTAIPPGGPPPSLGAIPFEGWLLYPSLDLFTQYSDNYFLSPQSKIAGWGFGVAPSLTAEWSNGIHTTTLFGNFSHIDYPTQSEINTNDGQATFNQKYAPLRDLSFTFTGDYTHRTIAPSLFSSIPTGISVPSTVVLSNGNIVLPNGVIVNPAGQVVGQTGPTLNVNGTAIVNPFDQYTASAQVDKLFYGGVFSINDTIRRTNFEKNAPQDFTSNSTSATASVALGPLLYAYTNGTFVVNDNTAPMPESQVYRALGGLGTRQIGLFRGNAYFGHQGSDTDGSPWAGGNIYGAALTYYPSRKWTLTASVDRTINLASGQVTPSNFAIVIPAPTPIQVPLGASTDITSTTLRSDYQISSLWQLSGTLNYTHVQSIGSSTWQDAWLADVILRHDIRRNVTLSAEYQYSAVITNVPFQNATRNFVTMSAVYKFN